MKIKEYLIIFFLVVIFLPMQVFSNPPQQENNTSIGFFTGTRSKIYRSGEVPINILPLFSFYYDGFYLRGISLGYEWRGYYPKPYVEITPNLLMLSPKNGYSEGLKRREWTIMGGGGLDFFLPYRLVFNTHIKVDMLNRYNSGYLGFGLKRTFMPHEKLMMAPSLFYKYYEKKYVDYYFGVSESEARADRPVYKGKNASEYGAGLFIMYFLNEKWSLQTMGTYSWLSKEITDSPLVVRKNMYSLYFGIAKKI